MSDARSNVRDDVLACGRFVTAALGELDGARADALALGGAELSDTMRELALVRTKLEEAEMWLARAHVRLA